MATGQNDKRIAIIGGGLAGCECAWQIARRTSGKVAIDLFEMRPVSNTPAHESDNLGELVCSNSLKSNDPNTPTGALKDDIRAMDSLIISMADRHSVPAGKALAVDRDNFAKDITKAIEDLDCINLIRQEVESLPEGYSQVVIASGPLTSDKLTADLQKLLGADNLYFYDAIAPIIEADSIDMSIAFIQDRYDEPGVGAYINLPLSKDAYNTFIGGILAATKVAYRSFEKEKFFEGCLPIEEIASRGHDSLAFGPLKPVGLTNPHSDEKPHAVIQLRPENRDLTAYNMVGFQTKLTYGEQKRIFTAIPALVDAVFLRYGSLHRNIYINSPQFINNEMSLKNAPHIKLAGQITGVEGYVESAAMGTLSGIYVAAKVMGHTVEPPPTETTLGALLRYITEGPATGDFQPANINFGLFPPLEQKVRSRKERRQKTIERAREVMKDWLTTLTL